jgi:hypothetical protein
MEVEKQIRKIIEFYCGGTYENRNTATKEILQICQNLQLQQTGVSNSIATEYAKFCIKCDRENLPLICLEDYVKQYCC